MSCCLIGLALVPLAACDDGPGEISRDASPFDGIDDAATITASGAEPFWNLRVAPVAQGYAAHYSAPELPEGETFLVNRFAGNNGLGFSGRWGGAPVNLTLTPGDCSDGMSEAIYPYTATLLLDQVTLYGCADTSDKPLTPGNTQ